MDRHAVVLQDTIPGKDSVQKDLPTRLYAHFKANSDSIIDQKKTVLEMKGLAMYLAAHPAKKVILTGNTGTNLEDIHAPVGGDEFVLSYPAVLNGRKVRTDELMIARATAIKAILVEQYTISEERIEIRPGTQTKGDAGRNVGVEMK